MSGVYTVPDLGPSDILDTDIEGQRRLKVASETVDYTGNKPRSSLTQELLTGVRTDFINVQFQYNLPVNLDSSDIDGTVTGTGEHRHGDSMAQVATGIGAGSSNVVSKDSIRYFTGHEFAAEMTALAKNTATGTTARWGVGDLGGFGDAMAFGYKDGIFGLFFRASGVEQFVPQSEFNVDKLDGSGPSRAILNSGTLNLWTFRGGWYGILPLQYGVFIDGAYRLVHVIDKTNAQDKPHLSNATLPMFIEVVSDGVAGADVIVSSASWRGGIVGDKPRGTKADRTQTQSIESKIIPSGALTPVITLRNNLSFQSKANHVRVRYGTIALSVDGTKPVIWEVHKNAALTGASFVSQNPDTSVADYDISATSMVVSGDNIGGTIMGKVSTTRINLFEGDVVLAVYPGETITLAAKSANNSEASLFFRWIEEF